MSKRLQKAVCEDYTHNVATDDELRRRAAEGDEMAIAELARRSASNRHLHMEAEQGDQAAVIELGVRLFNAAAFCDEASERKAAA